MKQFLTLAVVLAISITTAFAQTETVSGQITDLETGETMIGATIQIKETGEGTVTDYDGNFTIEAERGQTLVISYTGYEPQELVVGEVGTYNVAMAYSATQLEEIVVVGYGTQKSKDLTSSIVTVDADEIAKTPTGQAMQSLQGKMAGVQIVSSGAPGGQPTVRVRGIGSFPGTGNTNPLYVVDGMFFENIDFLNPSDIKTISVLKDASAAAIYGVRAANGVVLIETKTGGYNQKTTITYDGYYGVQNPQNVLQMANAEQFTQMAIESGSAPDVEYIENAMQRWGRSEANPNVPDVNTDWYKEVMRTAPITNHSINLTGGSKDISYGVSGSYFLQEGILDMPNDFERFNLRANVEFKATDWLKVGGNALISRITAQDPENGVWNRAYFAVPILPVFDELNEDAWPTNYANAQDVGYRGGQNPFSQLAFNDNFRRRNTTNGNFFAEFQILPKLKFRSSYFYSSANQNQRNVNLPYYIGNDFQRIDATISKTDWTTRRQIWDNLLTYDNSFGDHNLQVMLGTSYRDEASQILSARGVQTGTPEGNGFPVDNKNTWYISSPGVTPVLLENPDGGSRFYGFSYFGRFAWNYKHKYYLYGTMRADGNNKYQEKWGYFPSVGAGWALSEEDFFDVSFIDYLKLRASWGQLGNDNVPASDGANSSVAVSTAIDDQLVFGTVTTIGFSYLEWEVVEELNFGLSAYFADNRLSAEIDWYSRDTKNAALPVLRPLIGGFVRRNQGTIRNSGLEVALRWTDGNQDGFHYSIGANFTTLNNEVRDLSGQPYLDAGQAEFRQRSIVGEPIAAFFGLEVDGVYQNQQEIEADPFAVQQGLVPGDLRFKDSNGDGIIDADDRVVLGSYLPSFTYGGDINVGYKGLNLSVSVFGQSGNKILNRKRGEIIWTQDGNMDADLAKNRWHGEGTSNEYPSSSGLRRGWNQQMSTYFVEDGDFFRIQNVQLSYTLGDFMGEGFPRTTVRLTADRPLTVFNYNGFNPEHADGIDTQTFPVPATYTVGLNIQF